MRSIEASDRVASRAAKEPPILSPEDQASLERVHRALLADPEGGFTSALRLLRNTGKPAEALDHLVKIAGPGADDAVRQVLLRLETAVVMPTGSFWESRPVQAREDLFALSGFHLIKMQLLTEATARGDLSMLPTVRAQVAREASERVLASMVTYLGRLGDAADGPVLLEALGHPDGRVVSNALEALRELDVPVPDERLRALLEGHPSHRALAAVIAHLGQDDLAAVAPRIRAMAVSPDPDARAAAAYVCGELGHAGLCRQILIEMLKLERDLDVVRRIARSLLEAVRPRNAASIIGPIHALACQAQQESALEKSEILKDFLQRMAIGLEWSPRQLEEVGEKYLSGRDSERAS